MIYDKEKTNILYKNQKNTSKNESVENILFVLESVLGIKISYRDALRVGVALAVLDSKHDTQFQEIIKQYKSTFVQYLCHEVFGWKIPAQTLSHKDLIQLYMASEA